MALVEGVMFEYLTQNKEWIFSGVGVALLAAIFALVRYALRRCSTSEEKAVLASMPDLISRIRAALLDPQAKFVREFLVIPNRNVIFDPSKTSLALYEDEHQDLRGKCDVLEGQGLVKDITPGHFEAIRKYRMTERFVALVRR